MGIFAYFESRLHPTGPGPEETPPATLTGFYLYFVRQARWLLGGLFITGLCVALLDTTLPVFIGRVVTILSQHAQGHLFAEAWPQLAGMAAILLVVRPAAILLQNLVVQQAIAPGFTNLVRWQNHWQVIRQSWTFFQNDFAGRVANRVVQTGPALRDSVVATTTAVWYILVYGGSAIVLLSRSDPRLAIPVVCWFAAYGVALRFYVPVMRERSRQSSEARSNLAGRIVDGYTNILTVKLFARSEDEDQFVSSAVNAHTNAFRNQTRMISGFSLTLNLLNACMLVGTAAIALTLWNNGTIPLGVVATALPLTLQTSNLAGWVANSVTSIFDNIGQVQDGIKSIAVPRQMADAPGATALQVPAGEVRFEDVRFGYGTSRGVLHGIDLNVAPGEKVGLIGRSGAGKSTLVHLLLHLYRVEAGRILIDGQDIAGVTQESLRAHIALVTQDTSLLHRSVRENINYGRPEATEAEIRDAAAAAHALDFIEGLEDWEGRRAFEARVGERGVKLSAGQRQRIAIARVILKNAPILLLDEATSALDSEVEAAIQEQLEGLMEGRTVIAIAHRLSTIARMDRLIILDGGRIVEQGTHTELLAAGGLYASLWQRQSGGFEDNAPRLDMNFA